MSKEGERKRDNIKESFDKAGDEIVNVFSKLGEGLKSIGDKTKEALKTDTIAVKIDETWDKAIVQPTKRTIEFFEESGEKVTEKHRLRVAKAQEGAKRWKVVFAKPLLDIGVIPYRPPTFSKSDQDNDLIEGALMNNFVFAHVSSKLLPGLIDAFEPVMITKGTEIIKEGDVGDYFYVIGSGQVAFEVDGKHVGDANPGQTFGELALLYQAPRAATCKAKSMCGLFRLDQETFRRIMAEQVEDANKEVIEVLKKVPYFKDLDENYLYKIVNNLKVTRYNKGDVLANKGDLITKFVIMKEGRVKITDIEAGGSDYKEMEVGPGQFFGEATFVSGTGSLAKVTAMTPVVALTIDKDVFDKMVGSDVHKLIKRTLDKKKLALIPFGKRKGPAANELDLLASAVVDKKFAKGHVFFKEGTRCMPSLYLVRKGEVSIGSSSYPNLENILGFKLSEGEVKRVGHLGYFGNDTLGDNETGEFGKAKYTCIALTDVEVGVLDLNAIKGVVIARSEEEKMGLKDLEMVRIIGAGTFGKVWLCTMKGSNEAYALKSQVKKQLIEYNQADGVIREKNIMEKLDHPFIIKMMSSFKDENKLYMLLKLYQGGELQTVIHTDTRNGIPEWAARFYAANILEGLSHMHHRNIVYRDLKPENVLLDSEGYCVIVDLGFAKVISGKTYTFCGTPLYLAPEIIKQKGHDKGADHWSWGVLVYEMIQGMTPFYDGKVDQMGLFKNIVKRRMQPYDDGLISEEGKDLINRILVVEPEDRLGSFAAADKDIKEHPFFNDIDWQDLQQMKAKVPFKPKVKDPLDGSNFDDYSKLEAKEKKARMVKLTGAEQRLFDAF
mmetsp:Transcript_12553/g.19339  ORF Transcript_12553/g.19339 Transcript_12553/m.19339 type:complete len:835 (+) Transcript_12553:129-2633(+)